jgi:hypothetical protein
MQAQIDAADKLRERMDLIKEGAADAAKSGSCRIRAGTN